MSPTHAGVGIGTAYRRFANKDELIEAIVAQQTEELEAILADALAHPDAWDGLVFYLERSLAIQAKDRGMAQVFSGRHTRPQKYDWSRDRLAPLVNQVTTRACQVGQLREDVTGSDLILMQVAVTSLATMFQERCVDGREDIGDLYRRYLWIVLDGLRPHRDATSELPIPSLTTEQVHTLLAVSPQR